jgi:hypothetical protein
MSVLFEEYNEQHVGNRMSAYQAGGVAEAAEASVLFPTHIDGRYGPNPVRLEPDLRQSFDGMHMPITGRYAIQYTDSRHQPAGNRSIRRCIEGIVAEATLSTVLF